MVVGKAEGWALCRRKPRYSVCFLSGRAKSPRRELPGARGESARDSACPRGEEDGTAQAQCGGRPGACADCRPVTEAGPRSPGVCCQSRLPVRLPQGWTCANRVRPSACCSPPPPESSCHRGARCQRPHLPTESCPSERGPCAAWARTSSPSSPEGTGVAVMQTSPCRAGPGPVGEDSPLPGSWGNESRSRDRMSQDHSPETAVTHE
ncbi:uncharacterized protein LOC125090817 isoform X2 [Lutra lutra]|uniref:uncharacterized protein LOC125090817 isoform X2 n=1 Tax=Lutra lutra TaxID=9657 RepID=UPI001FD45384|nr:uncharacterized protein LOC125090817 isoform X2 [Lutra lutra]